MNIEDLEIEQNKITPSEKKEEELEIPKYMSRLELSEEVTKNIIKEIIDEKEAIDEERQEDDFENFCDAMDAQYEGNMDAGRDQQFTVHRHLTKDKTDKLSNRLSQACIKPDPLFTITPRPEFAKTVGREVCDKKSDFLDYKLDEVVPIDEEMQKVAHSTSLKGLGFLHIDEEIEREQRRREEVYEGPDGARSLVQAFGEAITKYAGTVKQLMLGKKKNLIVKYKETTYNDPMPKCVDIKKVWIRRAASTYRKMATTQLIAEEEDFSWWGLKKLEKKSWFYDIDKLIFKYDKDGEKTDEKNLNFKKETYKIFKCTFYADLEDGKDRVKSIFWINIERKLMIGSINFPWYSLPCQYIPFHILNKRVGTLYQPGFGEYLTDDNITVDYITNFMLEGIDARNRMSPIANEDSAVAKQMQEKRWTFGMTMFNDGQEKLDFVQSHMPQIDVNGMLNTMAFIFQGAGNKTSITDATSGRSDPVDPRAPAQKTLALLTQNEPNIEEYVTTFAKSFNHVGNALMAIYYQMSSEGRAYKIKPERVVGGEEFGTLSRDEMIARTSIQTRASVFAFDKLNEKREWVTLKQILDQEPLFRGNPESVYAFIKMMLESWSPVVKSHINRIWPSLEDMQKQQLQIAVQGVQVYVDTKVAQSKEAGEAIPFEIQELVQMIQEMPQGMKELATPPPEDVQKARAKEAEGAK